MTSVRYQDSPALPAETLSQLFASSWPNRAHRDFAQVLARSLVYVCAFADSRLIGFVNIAWDGGDHAFLLDTTVHPEFQRRGIGLELVRRASATVQARGVEWLHVDYEPALERFYGKAGFRTTAAGLRRLNEPAAATHVDGSRAG